MTTPAADRLNFSLTERNTGPFPFSTILGVILNVGISPNLQDRATKLMEYMVDDMIFSARSKEALTVCRVQLLKQFPEIRERLPQLEKERDSLFTAMGVGRPQRWVGSQKAEEMFFKWVNPLSAQCGEITFDVERLPSELWELSGAWMNRLTTLSEEARNMKIGSRGIAGVA